MRHNKAIIIGVIALATLGLMQLDQTHATWEEPPVASPPLPAATMVPDATFTLLDGGTVSLHSLKGHTVWLHFWASWCLPCQAEFPHLLESLQKDENTILLAVSGDKNATNARVFLAPLRAKYKPLFDSGRVIIAHDPEHKLIENTFQTFQYPETIIIGPDLAMQRKIVGIFQ